MPPFLLFLRFASRLLLLLPFTLILRCILVSSEDSKYPFARARFLLRDRDSIGEEFRSRVARMGIEEVITTARSPWQNPYAERLIGSIRRECLDHLIVFNERQLRRILREYFAYYNEVRPHQSLEMNAPVARVVEPPAKGKIISLPQVGGLHDRYLRAAYGDW